MILDLQILVYEYMPNGTLKDHLSGKSSTFMYNLLHYLIT